MLLEEIRCANAQGMHLLALRAANDLAALTPELGDRAVRETLGQCMTRIHAPAYFPQMRRARERLALMGRDVPQHQPALVPWGPRCGGGKDSNQ